MWRIVLLALLALAFLAGCGGAVTSTLSVESYPPLSISYPAFGPFMIGFPINPIAPIIEGGTPSHWIVSPEFSQGVLLDPETGVISGTPLEIQTPTPYTIFAENSSGQVTVVVLIYVLPTPPCDVQYETDSIQLPQGFPFDPLVPVHGCGAADFWSISPAIPAGLTLNPATGTISGTPQQVSPASQYVVTAANSVGSDTVLLSIEVLGTPPCDLLYSPSQIAILIGEEIPTIIPGVGCGTVESFNVAPGLPAGLSLDPLSGAISGIAAEVSAETLHQVVASNAYGSTSFSLVVSVDPLAPCDLEYSTMIVTTEVDVPLEPLSPTVGCGAVDAYSIEPELPAGLILDPVTGVISGAGLENAAAEVHTVTASNVTGQSSFSILIEVVSPPCNLSYSQIELNLQVGLPMSLLVPSTGCGAVDVYGVIPLLPEGIHLDPVTGVFFGTPSQLTEQTLYEIIASNTYGQIATLLLITVAPEAPCDLQYPVSPLALTVGEEMSPQIPTSGCGVVESFSVSPALPDGVLLDPVTGVISGLASEVLPETAHDVIATNVSGSTSFPLLIRVDLQAPCDLSYPVALVITQVDEVLDPLLPTVGCGAVETFSIDPALPIGLALDPATGEISGIALETSAPEIHTVTASNVTGETSISLVVEVVPPPPCNLSYLETELILQVGIEMSLLVPTSGCGPVDSYDVVPELPQGVQLDAVTGVLSGTPNEDSPATLYEIEASNDQGHSSVLILITILPAPPCDLQYPVVDLILTVGEEMTPLIPTSGCGPVESYTILPPLPQGVSLDSSSGIISGTPQLTNDRFDHVILAGNGSGTTSFLINVTVVALAPCDLFYPLASLILEPGEDIGFIEPSIGCGAPEFWQVTPALPDGMSLDSSSGIISGAPSGIQDLQTHLISAINSSGSSNFELDIWVQAQAPCDLVYPETELILLLGEAMATQIPSSGCGEVDLFEINPALPSGVGFDPLTGSLSGIPLEVIPFTVFQVVASNETGSVVVELSLEVLGQGPCGLSYPQTILAQPVGVPLPAQVPTSECGAAELWLATPALPQGLELDPDTGIISGTALEEGESTHVIHAENAYGSSEVSIEIFIRDVFLFQGGPLQIPYSPVTGEGSGSLTLHCTEGSLNPGFPTYLAGLSMAIQHDPALINFAGSVQGTDIGLLNGGTGPDFWAVNSLDGTILIGVLVSFSLVDYLTCDEQREIVVIDFVTTPETLQGNTVGVSGSFEWGNPQGTPPLDNLIVIDGTTSVDPVLEPISYELTPQ